MSLIVSNPSFNTSESKILFSKASVSINFNELGQLIVVTPEFANALSPIVNTLLGNVTSLNKVVPSNVEFWIDITLPGITTLDKEYAP